MTIGIYQTSGFSNYSIPICANMQLTNAVNVPELSGAAYDWDKDIAIGKIGIRISEESAFPFNGDIIHIVYDPNDTPSVGTMTNLGYFETRTSAAIQVYGEWQPLTYTSAMYLDQYEYFTDPSKIYAYSTGHSQYVSGDGLSVTDGYITAWPSPTYNYNWLGGFDIRIFYDKINYAKLDDEIIKIDAATDDQATPKTKSIAGDGYVELRWVSGSYTDYASNESTVYSVSGTNSREYYTDKNGTVKIDVDNGDTIYIYVHSDAGANAGNMAINYIKEDY
jgi:hypothetical protein